MKQMLMMITANRENWPQGPRHAEAASRRTSPSRTGQPRVPLSTSAADAIESCNCKHFF